MADEAAVCFSLRIFLSEGSMAMNSVSLPFPEGGLALLLPTLSLPSGFFTNNNVDARADGLLVFSPVPILPAAVRHLRATLLASLAAVFLAVLAVLLSRRLVCATRGPEKAWSGRATVAVRYKAIAAG
jgi:hypothetical protein